MTIKFSTANSARLQAPDHPSFSYPASDWVLGFVIVLNGDVSGTNLQFIAANSVPQNGALNVLYSGSGYSQPNTIGVNFNGSSTLMAAPNNTFTSGAWQVFLHRVGNNLNLSWCPILTSAPTTGAAVTTVKLTDLYGGVDGDGAFTIGSLPNFQTGKFLDQSLGRMFRFDGQLTTLEMARLAYGEEITDLGKTPAFYVRMLDASDITDRGPSANVFTAGGAAALATGASPGYGYVAGGGNTAPAFTTSPTIVGTPTVGTATTYTPGTKTGTPTPTATRQWTLDGADISGATAATYTPVAGDVGKALRVRETATNSVTSTSSTSAPATVAAAGVNSVTDLTAHKIYQRIGTSASIALAGTYAGAAASIEAQLYAADGTTVLQAWTALTATTINGGNWAGTLAANQGGMYRMAVRFKDSGGTVIGTTATTTNQWGVGDLYLCFGDSHSATWFRSGQYTPSANVRRYYNNVWETFSGTNGMAVTFANGMNTRSSVPIGMVDAGVSGSRLFEWNDAGSYLRPGFDAKVAAVGGKFAGVMCSIGTNDAANGSVSSRASHLANLRALATTIRTMTGQPSLKWLHVGMTRRQGVTDAMASYVRAAENDFSDDANTYLTLTVDLELGSDLTHLTGAGYEASMVRNEAVFGPILTGGAYRRGPKISAFTYSGTEVTITLQHRGSTDITPTSNFTGFTVTDSSGTPGITARTRVDATHLKITCDRPLTGTVTVKYLYGGMPDITALVYDNGTPVLPMHQEVDMVATLSGTADTTKPQLTGTIAESAVTFNSFDVTCPIATDNVAVTGYEWSADGTTYTAIAGGGRTVTRSGLSASTNYTTWMRATDAAGNKSDPLTKSTTTAAAQAPTRTVNVTFNTDATTKAANLTGIRVAFSTGTGPHDAGTRLFESSTETTDANGLMTFTFNSSAISAGQEGLLSVLMPDKKHYLGLVAVA